MEFEMVTVKYHDLSMAFAFVSSAAAMENHAYVSLDTGAIYWVSERDPIGKEELPDDLEGSDHYIEIPRKNDLELGNDLALRFVRERLPDQFTEVRDVFHQRGAYARFKHFLSAKGRLEEWYAFEAKSTDRALREWCEEHQIQLVDDGGQELP